MTQNFIDELKKSENYLGCWKNNNFNRILRKKIGINMNFEQCKLKATSNGYKYFG